MEEPPDAILAKTKLKLQDWTLAQSATKISSLGIVLLKFGIPSYAVLDRVVYFDWQNLMDLIEVRGKTLSSIRKKKYISPNTRNNLL